MSEIIGFHTVVSQSNDENFAMVATAEQYRSYGPYQQARLASAGLYSEVAGTELLLAFAAGR